MHVYMHVCVCVCMHVHNNQDKCNGMLDLHVFLTTVLKGNMNVVHNLSFVLSKLLRKHIIMHTKRYHSTHIEKMNKYTLLYMSL